MSEYFNHLPSLARFDPAAMAKVDVARGDALLAGLNCLEPGQSQRVHAHAGADKFYLVLSGKARMRVADDVQDAAAGTLVWAPAGVPHGIDEALERTVVLVALAPPPGAR